MNDRYIRQITLPQIGIEGQKKLAGSSVLVVGAGGLGSPALMYLAAAGTGKIGIVDHDVVEQSNLNRQILYGTCSLGHNKTGAAKEKLQDINNETVIISHNTRLTGENAAAIFKDYSLVLGAVDSFETRNIINKTCVSLDIPYIDAGINGFSGYVFYSFPPETPCLNCLFPGDANKKTGTGVFGPAAGVIGSMQAGMALGILLGLPNHAAGRLVFYDGMRFSIDHVEVQKNPECPVCNFI